MRRSQHSDVATMIRDLGPIVLFLIVLYLICGAVMNFLTGDSFMPWRDM